MGADELTMCRYESDGTSQCRQHHTQLDKQEDRIQAGICPTAATSAACRICKSESWVSATPQPARHSKSAAFFENKHAYEAWSTNLRWF